MALTAGTGAAGPGVAAALGLAFVSTVLLATLHLLAPRIRKLPLVPERATASFGGGLAVAYVFLHLIPELARGSQELRGLYGEEGPPSALVELAIFVVALVGFLVFYTLERIAQRSRTQEAVPARAANRERPVHPPDAGSGPSEVNPRVFWVHLGSFLVYNAIITYTLPSTYRTGAFFAGLFTVAMALHFVLSDRALEEHYGPLFDRRAPRLLLAGALLVGWALAALAAPTRSIVVSLLTAFLAGSILLNVFAQEIPSGRRSSLRWFATGLAVYAVLLGAITALEGRAETAESVESGGTAQSRGTAQSSGRAAMVTVEA